MAAIPAVKQVLQEWDIKQTDVLLEKLEANRNTRQEQEKKLREAENNRFVLNLCRLYVINQRKYVVFINNDYVVSVTCMLAVLLEIPLTI